MKNVKYALVPVSAGIMAVGSALPVLAAGEDGTAVTASDWASVISSLTSQISVSTVVGVLATTVAAGVGLVFMWWGTSKGCSYYYGSVPKRKNVGIRFSICLEHPSGQMFYRRC